MKKHRKINDWLWGILAFVSVSLVLYAICHYCGSEDGKNVSGILSVAGSIGAMVVITLTLKEQQKENQRKDTINSFEKILLRFNEALEKEGKYEYSCGVKYPLKEYLCILWNDDSDDKLIRYKLCKIQAIISKDTHKYIEELKKMVSDNDLKIASDFLLLLYNIKCRCNSNSETSRLINHYWETVSNDDIKECVGFYWSWNEDTNEEIEGIVDLFQKLKCAEIQNTFGEKTVKIPENIPNTQINYTKINKHNSNWINHSFTLICPEYILLKKAELDFFDGNKIECEKDIPLPKGECDFSLKTLFPDAIERLTDAIEKHLNKRNYLNFYIRYRNFTWTYRVTVEFSFEKNSNEYILIIEDNYEC